MINRYRDAGRVRGLAATRQRSAHGVNADALRWRVAANHGKYAEQAI
jgi:hypothetical protein